MRVPSRSRRRSGRVLVECAIVYPLAMMLVLGTIIAGMGVFRYQQVSHLAREGARWASVHGATYQKEENAAAITSASVMTSAITPIVVALDTTKLTCTLDTASTSGSAKVTVSYQWVPEAFFSPVTITSSSTMPITY